ncbi:armadillo-type protein [Obelidium mucronatum]|nr:armadillo-type protein [Obelidium mucronatum]
MQIAPPHNPEIFSFGNVDTISTTLNWTPDSSSCIQVSAFGAFYTLLVDGDIDSRKSVESLLQLMSRPPAQPSSINNKGFSQSCGWYLTTLMLRQGGIEALLTVFLSNLEQSEDPGTVLDISHALSNVARIITTIPKQCASPQEYFVAIGPQITNLIESLDPKTPLFRAALYITTQLLNRGPKLGKKYIIDPLLATLSPLYSTSSTTITTKEQHQKDLEGNEIIISEHDVQKSFRILSRLVTQNPEPSFALLESLQPAFLPIYKVHEFMVVNSVVSKTDMPTADLLKDLLRLNSVEKTQTLLSQLVLYTAPVGGGDGGRGVGSVVKLGDDGGVMFVRVRDRVETRLIHNPEAFVEFLVSLENNDLTCGVFLDLLEEYIKSSSTTSSSDKNENLVSGTVDSEDLPLDVGNLMLIQILMILIERFGANLITGTRRVIELVKSIVTNTNSVDSGCLLLCLTILKSALTGIDESNVDVRKQFELSEFLIVLQTLEHHKDEGIQTVAKDVRRLILVKSGSVPADAVAAETHASELLFAKSMLELSDELLPLRAHGIDQLCKMVLRKDSVAHDNLSTILCSFLDMLQDVDSYIYLHTVTGLSALTDVYPCESLHEIISRYSTADYELDYRLRIGEVAAKTIQRAGPVFPKYAPEILPQVLRVLHDENPALRGSALSLLSVVGETAPLPLLPFLQQILDYIETTLVLETNETMRQGAVLALLTLVRGMDGMYDAFPKGTLKKIAGRLRIVKEMDLDELTRFNAGVALDDLKDRVGFLGEFL